jgi:predicted dehydrogenase
MGFAILGTGMIAEYHSQAIAANADLGVRLAAVAHYDPARFTELGARFGVPCVSQEEMLADPAVDVVCICTPSGHHAAQTIAAANAGKHVLVEKPMALNLADADAMISACEQAGVKLGVTFQSRAKPLFQRIRRAIEAGDLGELTLGLVTLPYYRPMAYYNQADWRGTWAADGGGVLMNQGIHQVDLLLWFMGDPVEVQAYADTQYHDVEVEDVLAATLRFENGALATITASTTAGTGFAPRIEVYGTQGGIQTEGDAVVRWLLSHAAQATVEPLEASAAADAGAGGDPRGISAAGHIALFRDFVHALRGNRAPLVDGAEGRRSVAAVLAVYQAAGLL